MSLECVVWLVLLGWPHKPSQLPTDCNVSHWDLTVTIKKALILNMQVTLSGKAKAPCPLSNTGLPWDFSDLVPRDRIPAEGWTHQTASPPALLLATCIFVLWPVPFYGGVTEVREGGHVGRVQLKKFLLHQNQRMPETWVSMELQVFKDSMLLQIGIIEHLLY